MSKVQACARGDEHEPHHADDIRWLPDGYDCPGIYWPERPREGDTDADIAHKLEQWNWDESQWLEQWQAELLAEATKRLRRA